MTPSWSRGLWAAALAACGGLSERRPADAEDVGGRGGNDRVPDAGSVAVGASGGGGTTPGATGEAARAGAVVSSGRGPTGAGGTDAGGSAAAAGDTCAEALDTLDSELAWHRDSGFYTLQDTIFFDISPGGERLATPPDEHLVRGYAEYAVASGESLRQAQDPLLGRDREWRRDLVWSNYYSGGAQVVDRASGRILLELADYRGGSIALSGDGERVAALRCDGSPRIERHIVASGVVETRPLSEGTEACSRSSHESPDPLVMTASGDSVLFAAGTSGDIVVVDLDSGATRRQSIYSPAAADPSEWPPANLSLALRLSPSGRRLATTAVGQPLRVFSYSELAQVLPDREVSYTVSFPYCYCPRRFFSPLAWSADERWLASSDEAGRVVVRRACDGSVVATLPSPGGSRADAADRPGPALLAFTPRGDGIAVLSVARETMWVGISFYRLWE